MKKQETARARLRDELRDEVREELRRELREEVAREERRAGGGGGNGREDAAGFGPRHARHDGPMAHGPLGGLQAMGVGALGAAALLLLADQREKLRPAVVAGLKEVFRFRDWFGSNLASVREDLADMSAEARAAYDEELARQLAELERERELVQRLQDLSRRRGGGGSGGAGPGPQGGH